MRKLHATTFEYLKPGDEQVRRMAAMRHATKDFAELIDRNIQDGADKTYILRKLREIAMWVNVAITRDDDGAPRPE